MNWKKFLIIQYCFMNHTTKYGRKAQWICMFVIEIIQLVKSEHLIGLVSSRKKDIKIPTCSLYTLHLFFQTEEKATDWNVKKLFSVYKIFDESPSCRADNKQITSATSSDYPLNFCLYHWIENLNVAKQAQIIWSKIVKVIKFTEI